MTNVVDIVEIVNILKCVDHVARRMNEMWTKELLDWRECKIIKLIIVKFYF